MRSSFPIVTAAVVLLSVLAGCDDKAPEDSATMTNSVIEPASPYSRPTMQESAPQPAAVPDNSAAALATLTQAVRRFSAERQRVPANLDEVVRAGYVASIPAAPPGKKYVLNSKRLEVTLD